MAHAEKTISRELEVEAQRRNNSDTNNAPNEIAQTVCPLPEWVTILLQLAEEARAEASASAKRLSFATKSR